MNIKEHAKEQTERMSVVLRELANACFEFDSINEYGTCVSCYMDYDEQDCFNATAIFAHVMSCYGIHNGHVTDKNCMEIGQALKGLCKRYGIDTEQEASVKKMLNNL